MYYRRNSHSLLLDLLLFLLLAACVPVAPSTVTEKPAAEGAATTGAETGTGDTEDSTAFPVTIDNCGLEITHDAALQRAVTTNQAATEIMLALGLEGSMVGTVYMVVYPEGVWYDNLDETAIDRIVQEHFVEGQAVEEYMRFAVPITGPPNA